MYDRYDRYDATRPTGNALEETGRIPVLFTGDHPPGRYAPPPAGPDYTAIRAGAEFTALRRGFRAFVFPMSAAFFAWYLLYVLLAAYAHDFMSMKVFGQVNVGILLGVGQFASTALVTGLYLRFARRRIDPRVAELRARAGLTEGTPR